MKIDFMPEGFEMLKTEKKYWKLSQFKEGDTKFRIVCRPIAGWVDWKENKPLRYRPSEKPQFSVDPEKPMKAFWALYVWDYERKDLFILEVTQGSVIKSLQAYATDSDWGDFTGYDFKVKKEGSGKDTRYNLTALPHKEMAPETVQMLSRSPIRLEALYEGKDPWTDLIAGAEKPNSSPFLSKEQVEQINKKLSFNPTQKEKLLKWIGVDKVEDIPSSAFEKALKALDKGAA